MKKWKKEKCFIVGFFSCILLGLLLLPALAMEEEENPSGIIMEENRIAEGKVTDTVIWKITEDEKGNQTLIVSGEGPMADYGNQSQQPWAEWRKTVDKLIVKDGVTRIGNFSMYGMGFKEVQIGKDVEAIGKSAFAYGTGLESVRIPGNVKVIEKDAFLFHYNLHTVTLEEGIEVLEQSALGGQCKTGNMVHIPASLKRFDNLAVWIASGYTVAEDNPYYTAVEGVLYNKEKTALVDYPKKRMAVEYRIPDWVCEIKEGAFQRLNYTNKIYIPSSVQMMQKSYLFQWSEIEEVYVDDGVPFSGSSTFYGCSKLVRVRLPENIAIENIDNIANYGCNMLEGLKIPNGAQQLTRIGNPLKSFHFLIYDAKNARISDNTLLDSEISYELTIGENVDYLPSEFKWLSQQAEAVIFQKGNTFFVEAEAFSGQKSPLNGIEGKVHVDEQGILYQCDEEKGTATIIHCTDEFEDIFIPSNIQCEEGKSYLVTEVGTDSFKNASRVKSITFEKPEQIQKIDVYGFANCKYLAKINEETGIEKVKALFTGAEGNIGYRAFYNTGLKAETESGQTVDTMPGYNKIVLKGQDGESDLALTVDSEGQTLKWQEDSGGQGMYQLLTGDTLTVLTAAGNKDASEDKLYRVYFQWTESECSLSVSAGQTYTFDDQKVSCYKTEDPACVYIEFAPLIGKTLSIPVNAVYPSPSSKGGMVTIWSMCLNKEEAQNRQNSIVLSETGALRAEWITKKDEFSLSHTNGGEASVQIKGGKEGSLLLDRNLRWQTVMKRTEEDGIAYGKDYLKSISYQNTISLPGGMTWNSDVIAGVKNGNIRRSGTSLYIDEKMICNLSLSGGQLYLSSPSMEWDESTEKMVLTYKVTNSAKNAEMNTNTITCIFYEDAFLADVSCLGTSENPMIESTVEAKGNYQHFGTVTQKAAAQKTVAVNKGSLKLSKTTVTKPYYFGEKIDYEICLNNPGALSYSMDKEGSWIIQDTLSPYMYLEPEDMEKMFEESFGENLIIEIHNTEQVLWEEKQGVFEGTLYWSNGYNSGVNLKETALETLQIRLNDSNHGFLVESGETIYENEDLALALKQAGFAPGRWSEYILNWTMNEEDEVFKMKPGEERKFHIYGKAKDTFHMMSEDWPASYPTDASVDINSTAVLCDISGAIKMKASVRDKVIREAYIEKRAVSDGKVLTDGFTSEDGDMITYTLEFRHYGDGDYNNLPVVDEMYGSQALLVSVSENRHLSGYGLEICQKNGKDYYILTEGTYENVVIGGKADGQEYIAATIRVEKVLKGASVELKEEQHDYEGLHTRIEWNWSKMPPGRYRFIMSYDAVVRQEFSESNVYTLGNLVWMNDRKNSRIYAGIWGGGSIINFRKEILQKKGAAWKDDHINEEGYSLVSAGDSVTYRITLCNKGNGLCAVNGKDIADKLPANEGIFQWVRDENVKLEYESTHSSTKINNLDRWTVEAEWNGDSDKGQQYILWPEETQIEFKEPDAKVYLYITLQYPDDQGQEQLWNSYVKERKGTLIENTFFVYQFPTNVTHHLNEPGQVRLQKGVYGTSYKKEERYRETAGRHNYNNTDSYKRQVIYYVFLHNAGTKRWYLNDLYDSLPKGFVFEKFIDDFDLNKKNQEYSIITKSEFTEDSLVEIDSLFNSTEQIQYRSATIQWQETENGLIKFHFGAGNGNQSVCYDEERKQYYLNQNEAILFGYMCGTGMEEETVNNAVNTVFMYYEDYPKTGLVESEEYPLRITGARNEIYADQNDGDCNLAAGLDIKNQYDLVYGNLGDTWLVSDVAVCRGEIVPGVTKYTESYTSSGNGVTREYEYAAGPYDQINWRVRLHNSGTRSMTDYVLKDILPESYVLCDAVRYEIYDYQGNQIKTYQLFQIVERSEDKLTILNHNSKKTVSLDGQETKIQISNDRTGTMSVSKTEQGNEVLTIHFEDTTLSIPEGGYMDLYLSSNNPTNQYKNTVYTNQALLLPKKQPFDTAGQGSLIKDERDVPVAVKNNSPVTISFGYATGSEKAVLEKDNSSNKASAKDRENNYILLSDEADTFTYELTVTNETEKAMEKLIFIDRLPEEGDTSPFDTKVERQSQFNVSFAKDPAVRVFVESNGVVSQLEETAYSITYTDKTAYTEEDWKGLTVWSVDSENARAIRVFLHDQEGQVIPAGARVTVMFDCVIRDGAEAGETAWNSFGYHYKLMDVEQELEAMPLPVGVKIADIPKLEKQLKDKEGNPYFEKEDMEFRFLIYEGTELTKETADIPLTEEEKWIAFLEENNINYGLQSIVVKEGTSKAGPIPMDSIKWIQGQTYTIMELGTGSEYQVKEVNGREEQYNTFTYDRNQSIIHKFVNERMDWSLDLLKTDEEKHQNLKGAVFALYSLSRKEEKSESDFKEQGIAAVDSLEWGGQTWYLYDVKETDAKGRIHWEELKEDKYYLLEIKAPDGYELPEEGQVVYRKNAENGNLSLHIVNERGVILPRTGGRGTEMFIAVGTALIMTACIMRHDKKEKTKEK